MKNRTVIGVICMVVAVAITFLIAPIVNRLSTDSSEVIRLASDVKQGVQITADHLEVAKVKTDSIPDGVLNDPKEIIGKYASSMLYAGDYLTAAKLTGEANTASDSSDAVNSLFIIPLPRDYWISRMMSFLVMFCLRTLARPSRLSTNSA